MKYINTRNGLIESIPPEELDYGIEHYDGKGAPESNMTLSNYEPIQSPEWAIKREKYNTLATLDSIKNEIDRDIVEAITIIEDLSYRDKNRTPRVSGGQDSEIGDTLGEESSSESSEIGDTLGEESSSESSEIGF